MYFILLISIFPAVFSGNIITTTSGPVRGVAALVDDVEAFLGIPYAEPPVGERRFAKPVPKAQWKEVYEASKVPPPCAQVSTQPHYFMPDISNMSEDCLYLNIWVPKAKSKDGLRPVIVFFHPGLYVFGSASMNVHDGSKLASRGDVIVTSLNYRLGAFGFFWGFTDDAPGSVSIYDQIMAVKWIKENAKHFGGDPENIVLDGVSAGAFSTVLFILSPLTQNLFNRAIIESGSILLPMLEDKNVRLRENSESVASIAGCTNATMNLKTNPAAVVECMKRKTTDAVLDAQKTIMTVQPGVFFPRVYDEILPKSPASLMREGKFKKDLEVLTGVTSDEGTVILAFGLSAYFDTYGKTKVEVSSAKRARYIIRAGIMGSRLLNSTKIADDYMKSAKNWNLSDYTKLLAIVLSDIATTCPTVFTANFLSLAGIPVYFYKFAFRAASTPLAEWMGTTHLDEIQYVFGNPYHENFTTEETELSHRLMDRWSAFAWTGNPDIPGHVPWPRYSYQMPLYLNFGQEEESILLNPSETCHILKDMFQAAFDEH